MIKFRDYKLIRPDQELMTKMDGACVKLGGSVFHESFLNLLVSETFSTEFFYLINNLNEPTHFAPVHKIRNSFGRTDYHLKPLFDIPYAGFIGDVEFDISEFALGYLESVTYEGFPFYCSNNNRNWPVHGETCMVDLSMNEDQIFNKVINGKRRNMIRKALKEGIYTEYSESLEAFDRFWTLLKPLHDRLGFRDQLNYKYYSSIFSNLASVSKAAVILAYRENQLLSGLMLLGNANYMHYYKGASRNGVKNIGQGEMLQWEAIKSCKTNGIKFYDLCNLNKEKLPNIYSFKTGISKHIIKYPRARKKSMIYDLVNRIR